MKPKNKRLIALLFTSGLGLAMFQNCAKPPSAQIVSSDISSKPAENVAIARDSQGNLLPVQVASPEEILASQGSGGSQVAGVVGQEDINSTQVEVEKTPAEDMAAACGLSPKSIQQVVDLAQFKGREVSLDLIQGRTLLFSSDPQFVLSSLSLSASEGRAVLCGAKVQKVDLKQGVLEVYYSEIQELGERVGRLTKDPYSILPAGI